MKKLPLYQAETRQRITSLPTATPEMIQEYLQLCAELATNFPPQNIVKFPFAIDDMNNPYKKMRRWLEAIDFQPHGERISQRDIRTLSQLAEQPASELRQNVDSTEVKFDNPFLCRFSQIYIVNLLLSHLHVYNFLLENYIHESRRVRDWVQADLTATKNWRVFHRLSAKHCPAQNEYQYWVRDFLCNEALSEGSTPYSVYLSYCFGHKYRHHHPVILPAQRQAAIEAYNANRDLAKKVRRYAYYRWLQPSKVETHFIKDLRSERGHRDILFDLGPERLDYAVALAGSVDRRITYLVHHHSLSADSRQL